MKGRASPKAWRLIAALLAFGITANAAIADDTLYLRTAGHLYAFAEKK